VLTLLPERFPYESSDDGDKECGYAHYELYVVDTVCRWGSSDKHQDWCWV
jgi:hypothetical protein